MLEKTGGTAASQPLQEEKMNKSLEILNNKLCELSTHSSKLDFWADNYLNGFLAKTKYFDLSGNEFESRQNEYSRSNTDKLVFEYFESDSIISPALIPEEIYEIHFSDGLNNPEFTLWFLKFNAKKWAEEYYISKFKKKLGNDITSQFIEAELKQLNEFEEETKRLLINKEIDIENNYSSDYFKPFRELKRIQSNYYENNVVPFVHMLGGNSAVDIYSKHIYYKNWLIDKLTEIEPNSSENKYVRHSNDFSNYILRGIEALSRKPIKFNNEDDYRTYFYHAFSILENVYISAEEVSKNGRTDLMLKGEFGTKIIEFKIWGRNDYKEIIKQVVGYLTDFENEGYIFISNESQLKHIDSEYLAILKDEKMGLVGQIETKMYGQTQFKYYESVHKIGMKSKRIIHFIYNVNQ